MAGAMKRMSTWLGLSEDDEVDAYDRRGDRYDAEPAPVDDRAESLPRVRRLEPEERVTVTERATPRRAVASLDERSAYRITNLQPSTYNEARQVGEQFRDGIPVILNLSEMDDRDAKRLVDFAAGLVFGLRGSIERVTQKVFLLTPADVEVTAEDKARIAESGFFNQS